MAEFNFDKRTLALLTSDNPDIDQATSGKTSKAALSDGNKAIAHAKAFVLKHGNPPWTRLGLQSRAFLVGINQDVQTGSLVLYIRSNGETEEVVGTPTLSSPEPMYTQMRDWVRQSPIRQVNFPFGSRTLSLMLTHPEVERIIRDKADLPILEEMRALEIPEIDPRDYLMHCRTDAWISVRGNPRWFAVAMNTLSDTEKRPGRIFGTHPLTRSTVRVIEAMLTIGEDHFANLPTSA